jgi:O-antigen polymerase
MRITTTILVGFLGFLLACSLLNSYAFGSVTLISLFSFMILGALATLLAGIYLLFAKGKAPLQISLPMGLFVLFCLAIVGSMLYWKTTGFEGYFWLTVFGFSVAIYLLFRHIYQQPGKDQFSRLVKQLFFAITLLAMAEAVLVLSQQVGWVNSLNKYFAATGSWQNPNVIASFLSLSIFCTLRLRQLSSQKWVKGYAFIVLVFSILAILLLKSRTAYLVLLFICCYEYGMPFLNQLRDFKKISLKTAAIGMAFLLLLLLIVRVSINKTGSTQSRMQILGNTAKLIAEQPIKGYGFGGFEKTYNTYAAQQNDNVNDFVKMGYNDYLQLALEGGLPIALLWGLLNFSLLRLAWQERKWGFDFTPIVIAFGIIQVTNFGFQAMPSFALWLLLMALGLAQLKTSKQSITITHPSLLRFAKLGLASLGFYALVKSSTLTAAYYDKWMARTISNEKDRTAFLLSLSGKLEGFPGYHEDLGDAYLKAKDWQKAMTQYQQAFLQTTGPDLVMKMAMTHKQLGQKDSCLQMLTLATKMQPFKLLPKFVILRMHINDGDTALAKAGASAILATPVKVASKKAKEIKGYAKFYLDSMAHQLISNTANLKVK